MQNISTRKLLGIVFFLLWSAVVLSAFYITQNPLFVQIIRGTLSTLWAIILFLLVFINSAGLGIFVFKRLSLSSTLHDYLILGTGLGLGIFGLLGYGFASFGLASPIILITILFGIFIWICVSKIYIDLLSSVTSFFQMLKQSKSEVPVWLAWAITAGIFLAFFFALLPPAEGFDGLFYHLALPERLLADGKILPYAVPQFWFPGLMQGNFIWALALTSERTAQLFHWGFSVLTMAIIWEWAHTTISSKSAWWALAVIVSMPLLPWLASWAYNDFALIFYELACLYALWKWKESNANSWLVISAIFAGFSMSLKYTSIVLPIFCVATLFFLEKNFSNRIRSIFIFSIVSLLIASPWYLRNWLVMENPVYPFVFLGLHWDSFQANAYAGKGTGIGWNLLEIFLLPFNITLGHRDQNFYDGRIGPLFLLLFPIFLWALGKRYSKTNPEWQLLFFISSFALLNYLIWMYGVINTMHLWQARLLLPGLIPLTIPIGLGISLLSDLDLPRLRISFVATSMIGAVIFITLLDNSLLLLVRRPLEYALGIESRQQYFERIQPQYSEAIKLVNNLPKGSFVYFLFEPRSYNMDQNVYPDPININLLHDYYLYETPEKIIESWKSTGYTHVLVGSSALQYLQNDEKNQVVLLNQVTKNLILVEETQNYEIYSIP